ncbi:MAG: 50S ribosomal protein L23 [Nitriliruptor sp.]|uniref:50S ribosomal protein L23 n=1 Tax=Nitriliruptor sp. TaxID=2448056 RepID=UPI0034A08A5B
MKDPRDIILRPVISEKTYGLLDEGKYTFIVDPRSNKTEIKQAIEKIFDVRVTGVNTLNRAGKKKRRGLIVGKRANTKRAIVTLAPGDEIELFDAGL